MKKFNLSLSTLSILIFMLVLNSNFTYKENPHPKDNLSCIGMKVNNKWLSDPFDSKARALIDIHDTGKLTITDAPNNGLGPFTPVSFKIYIKKNEVFNAIPLPGYINESILEIDLEAILKHCNVGDKVVLEATDSGKYFPVFQEITVVDGC